MKSRLTLYIALIATCTPTGNPVLIAQNCSGILLNHKLVEECRKYYSIESSGAVMKEFMDDKNKSGIIWEAFPDIAGDPWRTRITTGWGNDAIKDNEGIKDIMKCICQAIRANSEISPSLIVELRDALRKLNKSQLNIDQAEIEISINAEGKAFYGLILRQLREPEIGLLGVIINAPMPEASKFVEHWQRPHSAFGSEGLRDIKLEAGAKKDVNYLRSNMGFRGCKELVIPGKAGNRESPLRVFNRLVDIKEFSQPRLDSNARRLQKALDSLQTDELSPYIQDSWRSGLCKFWSNYKAQSIMFMYLLYVVFNILVLETLSLTNIITLSGATCICFYVSLLQSFAAILLMIMGLFYNIECDFFFKKIINFYIKKIINYDLVLQNMGMGGITNDFVMSNIVIITFLQVIVFSILTIVFLSMGMLLSMIGIVGDYMIVSLIAQMVVFLFLEVVGMHSLPLWVATKSAFQGYSNPGSPENYKSPFFLMHWDLVRGRIASWIVLFFYHFFLQAYTPYLLVVIFIALISLRCDDLECLRLPT